MKHASVAGVMVVLLGGIISAPAGEKSKKGGAGKETSKLALSAFLETTLEMKDFQQPMSFKEFLGHLKVKLAPKGEDLPIFVNTEAFKEENPDAPAVFDTQIQFPPFPKKMKVAAALSVALRRFNPPNATLVLRDGFVEITTLERARPESLLELLLERGRPSVQLQSAMKRIAIDPKTPLAELLPPTPRTTGKTPWFTGDLTKVPEIRFQEPLSRQLASDKAALAIAQQLVKIQHVNQNGMDAFLKALIAQRADLQGLPYAMGADCRISGERAKLFALLSRMVRDSMAGAVDETELTALPLKADVFWSEFDKNNREIKKQLSKSTDCSPSAYEAACVAALMQVLAAESAPVRLGLVKHLSRIPHVEATQALAKLALFSDADEVRLPALEALKLRREKDYSAILIEGFRYPLPAVARRAAEAAVRLECANLVPRLVDLLEEGDPRQPAVLVVDKKKVPVVRELVRLNHHQNCMLCHAPFSVEKNDDEFRFLAAAPLPLPTEPLPSRPAGYQGEGPPSGLVDIQVTYLRQDFSLMQPVHEAAPWPDMQRFDFLVRRRILSDEEAKQYQQQSASTLPGATTPYQRAILFALRELTGRDTSPTPQAWRELLGLRK